MKSKNNPPAQKTGFSLVVSRVINAPCELVFRAWTDPEHMGQWFSPDGVGCRSFTGEVKVGGAYRLHMVSKVGNHIAIGKYKEILLNKRLQFTWERMAEGVPLTLVTVDFEDLGKTTRLTLTHEGFPAREDSDDHNEGWTSLLEKFGRLMEQGKIKS
ncbi:MAG: SRPBCC domain-containing protein [Limisphaerales bacterium]